MLFKHPLDVVILSTDIFLTVSTKHLMMLLVEKEEDSIHNVYTGKIRWKKSINFIREMVLVEDRMKREFLNLFKFVLSKKEI